MADSPNARHARRIAHVLTRIADRDTPPDGLIDLLTDARHWCARHGQEYARLDRLAYEHYLAETAGREAV